MDRLTDNHYTGNGYYLKCSGAQKCAEHCEDCAKLEEAVNRLAAYEDTGLTPEEVKDMAENAETRLLTWFEAKYGFPVVELMGLCEANAEGRIIILPCGEGEKRAEAKPLLQNG